MSVAVWWSVCVAILIGAIAYLFLHTEWLEDRPLWLDITGAPNPGHHWHF
jgi:uncharacterized membrane protein